MSLKKLQTEIDRVLKKVSEGVESFEATFDKISTTSNANQKEKYEQDLKKEIKKLQRLRDQIKAWLSSNEIKDKRALLENRKLIESQMERFKMIEKEMKMKAYSKEGLLQREKMDPREKEKSEACEWIMATKNELQRQMEMTEAELETLRAGTSKRGKKDHVKSERSSELENRIVRHTHHLNRLELTLRLLENDRLSADKVLAIRDDVQYYLECNQEPDFEEDEYIYDELNLDEDDKLYVIGSEDHLVNESPKSDDEEPPSKLSNKEDDDNAHILIPANAAASPIRTERGPSLPSGLKYAQAAAAGASHDKSAKQEDKAKSVENAWAEPPKITEQANAATSAHESTKARSPQQQQQQQHIFHLPASLADLVLAFEAIKAKDTRKPDMGYVQQMLDASLHHIPDLIDSERPKIYEPHSPCPTPSYYPQQPLPVFENPALFEKLDINSLFFVFYYQQGTYQQYLAAKELKKHSWRFHKKYLTWFQRHEEPTFISDEYEQGTYIYFDYEGAWCQRKKPDFRFNYRYLEGI
ncbi:Not1 N-terminal domain, CCR4-Not complex component-domain-containing protein [Dichotomocladium elegans]|nr:Not1 N-terminal domain, CCR4-Not complex component-domain-containing protein [Dichotomocladium elegans]